MLSLRPSVQIFMLVVQLGSTVNRQPESENISQDREYDVYQAKLAERAERYDEMLYSMNIVARLDTDLSVEEKKLLALASKSVIRALQASLRKLTGPEIEADKNDNRKKDIFRNYKEKIEGEIREVCLTGTDILDKYLIPNAITGESKVLFYKMKGDYYRYLAEFEEDIARKRGAGETALKSYKKACDIAMTEFAPTNPLRLELALNFSAFYLDILNSPGRACRLAQAAYDDAIAELDDLEEENYKESTLIMQLLRDNLARWTSVTPSEDQKAICSLG